MEVELEGTVRERNGGTAIGLTGELSELMWGVLEIFAIGDQPQAVYMSLRLLCVLPSFWDCKAQTP